MRARFIAMFGLSLAVVVGVLVAADWLQTANTPAPPGVNQPPAPSAPIAAASAPQPAASAPAVAEPPPAVTAPPPVAPAPAASAPPVPSPPVVAALPPAEPPPPVAAPPSVEAPPLVAAPSPTEAPPVVTAPPPAPVVAALPPAEAPPVVTAPPPIAPPPEATAPPVEMLPPVIAALPPAKPSMEENKQPAKLLFAAKELPTLGKAMAIGYYPRGCLQGGVELPVDGPNWQVMRLSRNRNWGHPELVKFLERFAPLAAKATGWKGILIGDMAQPRGGPLPFGHMSHQIGLDVDIWFMPDAEPQAQQERARGYLGQQSGRRRRQSTSIRRPGRRRISPSSRPRPSSPRSSACWSMPRSRRNYATSRTRNTTAGWRRCGPGTATPITSMCG